MSKLKNVFGLTPEEYETIIEFQKGACAICKRPPRKDGIRLSVDHDHKSGLVRGGLCWLCNRMLGFVKEDLERLQAMEEYLQNPPAVAALGREVYGRPGRVTNKRKRKRRAL